MPDLHVDIADSLLAAKSTLVNAICHDGYGLTYDLADHLTGIDPTGSSNDTTFTLDALGRFASRTINGTTDAYDYVGTGETVTRITTGSTITDSIVSPSGDRLGVEVGTTLNWFVPDPHGNVAGSLDASEATVVNAIRYDAWGQTLASGSAGGSAVGDKSWAHQGRLDLSPQGLGTPLYDMSARFYNPGIGAFTQLDSVMGSAQNPLSMNRFLYAEGNPATLIDPTGHDACSYDCDGDYDDGSSSRGNHDPNPNGTRPPTKTKDPTPAPAKKTSGSGDAPKKTPTVRTVGPTGGIDSYTAYSSWSVNNAGGLCDVMHPLECQEWTRQLYHNADRDGELCKANQAICEEQAQEARLNALLAIEITAMIILLAPSGTTSVAAGGTAVGTTLMLRASNQQRLSALTQALTSRIGRTSSLIGEYDRAASGGAGRWQRGMDIYTKIGTKEPAWSTVRSRYWKNQSMDGDAGARYGPSNLERMRKGLAPQRANKNAPNGRESLELSHEPVPQRAGGRAFVERWPCDHALHDDFRFPGYC